MLSKIIACTALSFVLLTTYACKKTENEDTKYFSLKFKFSNSQPRLDNNGQSVGLAPGHAAQSPDFNKLSIHYIELVKDEYTQLGQGAIIYRAPEKNIVANGFTTAIDFDLSVQKGQDEIVLRVPISAIQEGNYKYVRASVGYQNYTIKFNINQVPSIGDVSNQNMTISSWIGYNTYINSAVVRTKTLTVNGAKKQGFWAAETDFLPQYAAYNSITSGQASGTTVVNPLASFGNPVPAGSCVITGASTTPIVIGRGVNAKEVAVTLSFSTNQSFEWIDSNNNGKWDITYPSNVEQVVDMGLRGMQVRTN